jgi:hypothetical protein
VDVSTTSVDCNVCGSTGCSPSSSPVNRFFIDIGGEGGGVLSSRAWCTTSGGGRARGDIIIPGACEGSCGRRDQIAQPPNGLTVLNFG